MIQTEEKIVKCYKVGITNNLDNIGVGCRATLSLSNGDTLQYQNRGDLRNLSVITSARDTFSVHIHSRTDSTLNNVNVGCQIYNLADVKAIVDFLSAKGDSKVKAYQATPRSKLVPIVESSTNYHILANGKAVEKTKGQIVEIDKFLFNSGIKITQLENGSYNVIRNSYTWRIRDKDMFIKGVSNILAIDALYRGIKPNV